MAWGRKKSSGRQEPQFGLAAALSELRWLIEELRVSLFAQELRTPVPVSFKRVEKAWADIAREG